MEKTKIFLTDVLISFWSVPLCLLQIRMFFLLWAALLFSVRSSSADTGMHRFDNLVLAVSGLLLGVLSLGPLARPAVVCQGRGAWALVPPMAPPCVCVCWKGLSL